MVESVGTYRPLSSGYLERTTGLPSMTNFTICGWAQENPGITEWGMVFALGGGSFNMGIARGSGAVLMQLQEPNNQLLPFTPAPPKNDMPLFMAVTAGPGTGNTKGYWRAINGGSFGTAVSGVTNSWTPAAFRIGNSYYDSTDHYQGRIWNVRVWDRPLSADELMAESESSRPVSTRALHAWYPLNDANYHLDHSGNGRHLTKSGGGGLDAPFMESPDAPEEIWFPKRITILAATGMTITNVAPSILYENLTNIIITGTGFGASQGTKTVYLDDKLQTVTAWTNTSITITAVSPNLWANARLLQVRNT